MRLRSKAFLISTGILMLAVLASVVIGGLVGGMGSLPKVSVVEGSPVAASVQAVEGLDVRLAPSTDAAEALVRDGTVDAAVLGADGASGTGGSAPSGYTVIALDSAPTAVVQALSVAPTVQLLEPSDQNPLIVYFVALAFGLVFFMSAITFGSTIAQSVVEEKQTRVVEILLSTIPVRALLAGKVLGNSLLAFGQIAAIAVLAGIGLLATGQSTLLASLGPSIIWFVVFFAFGFVLLASLYAATAALVSRQEDIGSVTAPVTMLVMIPYFLVIFFNDNPLVLGIMSYVPFSAPVGMPMRLFLGTAQWWEPLLALVVLVIVTAGVIVLGSRIYSNSLLRTGARVKLRDALRG
ncbi:ABC transporter permease [Subtercola boreus]|uniref:Sodium ABC transporter permease n=1 Tax=Subtercola boreus TaxID=120213 RepID=A0A3E0W8I6_9MICO|nr:ABC transporter permease [Subtercola boreus]RFA19132.1 sodium ABC transporter permease [Subtercola boreus]RFA19251.1 sodium ABC transporter permease [Subtercola boreus]RFA25731.1 sodium ABC transporter permease [Subtercola boreus]